MTDLELLELAAKAASGEFHSGHFSGDGREWKEWNPLIDTYDALRLASTLKIDLCFDNAGIEAVWIDEAISETHSLREHADLAFEDVGKRMRATCRAIVRAAAEIGKEAS